TSYYFVGGIVATFAVLLNVTLILAVMAGLEATFTLPSIAGIVLTIGTAVDAHVLIFERLREEQHRGLSIRMALRNAHAKALSAILDSNMTTIITSVFLIWFGTEEVKGFGITLIIGIVASLFTSLFCTRTILETLIDDFGLRNISSLPLAFPKWDKLLRPNIDWMKLAPYFITFSILGIGSGTWLFARYAKAGEMLSIDFTSGTSAQFQLKQPLPIHEVRELLKQAPASELPSFSIVSIGQGNTTYEVDTPNPNAVEVRDAVIKSLVDSHGSMLNVEVPSSFDGAGKALTEVQNKVVIPITSASLATPGAWKGPFKPRGIGDFNPGVAIFLNHLNPPLSVSQIRQRIADEQQSEAGGNSVGAAAANQEFTVVGANGASTGGGPTGAGASGDTAHPVTSAVVLATQSGIDYGKDPTTWQTQLAEPMWKLVNYGVNRPATLQQVKNFDAAVAGDTKDNAILALTLSIIVIMIYIWIRFGNLKYGTATVVALLHDTIFTIAALGFAHFIAEYIPAVARFLELEPFRIDLTIVAGILTIMGYSMIDTIVVFDRIRENRGKYGHVNRQVINDAINQTLSRTLLTAGTTTITVAIMYFVGGPGIHGFTFVLLFGILVGTYSSIAIAAPLLLLGGKGDKDQPPRSGPGARSIHPLQKAGA
ncbi:MAG TPA: protein translocase subunit SecF, partial [Tepidisphaeraceae bacterium]|nr:protein translocase subunit SecF [Tepidisphaeraceae bacterium]